MNDMDARMRLFIERHVAEIEHLEVQYALASWDLQTTSSAESQERCADLSAAIERVYARSDRFDELCSIESQQLSDSLLERQHILLMNAFRTSQMSDETIEQIVALEVSIEEKFNTYRPTIGGKPVSDNEIDDILINSQDSALRKEVWIASRGVGCEVEDRVLELVRLRNREAKRLGFENYYSMSLISQEQDELQLFELLDSLFENSRSLWIEYKSKLDAELASRFGVLSEDLQPWHHANRFFQEPGPGAAKLDRYFEAMDLESITARFFEQIALPVDDLLLKADLYERENKCQHAFCMDVDRNGDIRVLCNNRPDERWMSTTLHEFGHAVYDKFVDRSLPYILRGPAHTLTTEAIALYMGRLTKSAPWLHEYAGVDTSAASSIAAQARKEMKDSLLVFMRWCFVMCHFERALYQDPDQDLDALWWTLVERYQNISCPEVDRRKGMWAAKIHIATAPVYYHNYLLGEMTASQLLHYLRTAVLSDAADPDRALISSPLVGNWMKSELFAPGAVRRWDAWLQHATGETLNPAYYAADLLSSS